MKDKRFTVKFADSEEENTSAYALRYEEMLLEYRDDATSTNGLDITEYDKYAKQVICIDTLTNTIAGCYRLVTSETLRDGRFISEEEFNIDELKSSGEKIIELSRAVVKKEYRNSPVLMHLLQFIISYIQENDFRFVIGDASFFGTDKFIYVKELSYLAHYHAIEDYNVVSKDEEQTPILPKEELNAREILRSLPPLIRAYVTFGAKVSKTSFTDRDFGSVDVFILLDTQNYNQTLVNKLLAQFK